MYNFDIFNQTIIPSEPGIYYYGERNSIQYYLIRLCDLDKEYTMDNREAHILELYMNKYLIDLYGTKILYLGIMDGIKCIIIISKDIDKNNLIKGLSFIHNKMNSNVINDKDYYKALNIYNKFYTYYLENN